MSEEICLRSYQITFNEENFDNVEAALMREESDCIVESQQSTTCDEGLLKVLSFDSEVNITPTVANQSENTSSQLCKKTLKTGKSPVIITTRQKTYERKSKRKVTVPNIIKAKEPKKNVVDNNSSKSVKHSTIQERQNENVDKESLIQNSESHIDEEDEYSLIKIKENMHNCLGTRDKREKSVSSDNVASITIIRKRGRPKKNISKTERMKNKSKNNKSVIAKHEQSQGDAKKGTRKVGRPRKAKIDKLDVKNTQTTFESVMESSSLQSNNMDYKDKFENVKNVNDLVVENLKKIPSSLEKNTSDNTYYNNKINNTCHSKLKDTPTNIEEEQTNKKQLDVNNDDCPYSNSAKRSSRMPVLPDFEYNIDSILKESSNNALEDRLSDTENEKLNTCSSVENICSRPQRRKNKHNLRYDECSDEDPFANVELSYDDDEPIRFKKNRYYSDDEYIPITKIKKTTESFTSDSDIDKNKDELKIPRRRRKNTKSKKKEKKLNVYTLPEDTHQSEDKIVTHDDNSQYDEKNKPCSDNQNNKSKVEEQDTSVEGKSEEIENYLAKKIQGTNLKIKRVSNIEPTAINRLEIPVIDSYMAKKSVDACSQTNVLKTTGKSVQTTTAYDLEMKINVPLTVKQTEKACELLKDILKTSSELGELMTEKSEDFIQKKINTKHVIDTFKMDYCVKKSFLLFKLAKHNLMEMEESLAKQYEDFLKENNLLQYREVPKSITPTLILSENDSDCEIIEESSENLNQSKEKPKPKLNLKTVFLNKELSIKIAKKPSK